MNNEDRSEQLAHIIRGHENVQETIRALDNKSSILFAFAGAVIATTWQVLSELNAMNFPLEFKLECIRIFGMLVALGSVCLGGTALIQCLLTLLARGYPDGSELPTTVLFPYIPPKGEAQRVYLSEKINGDLSDADIRAEYLNQLNILGEIVAKKIAHNQKAVRMFIRQLVAGGILVFTYFCLLIAG